MENTYTLKKYFTLNNEGSSEQVIQRSRFIGYAKRINSEKEAQEFIQKIKKKHYDATHNCSAYLIGDNDEIQKTNDDGEPGGTAGIPILEVIKKRELKYSVIVVTRYFGGTKLGAGGLIRAYSSSASQVIDEVGIIEKKLIQEFAVEIQYPFLGKIQNDIKDTDYIINNIIYSESVILEIFVDVDEVNNFQEWIIDLTNNQINITEKEIKFIDKLHL